MLFNLWTCLRRDGKNQKKLSFTSEDELSTHIVQSLNDEMSQDVFPMKLEVLCQLPPYLHCTASTTVLDTDIRRLSLDGTTRSVLNSVISPLSSSSCSPLTPFQIKTLQDDGACPNQSLSDYISSGENGCFSITSLMTMNDDLQCRALIKETNLALQNLPPQLSDLGTGGVYFLRSYQGKDSKNVSAVFKPIDEEPGERNNPKGHHCCYSENHNNTTETSFSMKDGFQPGQGALRECAAYLLDYGSISGVPPTTLISLKAPTCVFTPDFEKIGSLQKFIPYDFDAEECGYGLFPVEEVHKICLADFRFINKDRNGQNILVTKNANGGVILTPIDHGYCFPDNLNDIYFEWSHWPQAEQAFGSKIRSFIEGLEPRKDLEVLTQNGIELPLECIRVFLFSNYFLKWAVCHRHFTPRDIAVVMSNTPGLATSSHCHCPKLEKLYQAIMKDNENPLVESEIYIALDQQLR
eukprot:g4912.t1